MSELNTPRLFPVWALLAFLNAMPTVAKYERNEADIDARLQAKSSMLDASSKRPSLQSGDKSASGSSSSTTICSGASAVLSVPVSGGVPPYTYSWVPAATLDDPTLANPTATPPTTTTYTATVTDGFGWSGIKSVTVVVSDPQVVASTPVAAACLGGTFPLFSLVSGGQAPYTYSWSPAAKVDDPTSPNPTGSDGGLFTVTITDALGCVASDTLSVDTSLPKVSAFVSSGSAACGGQVSLLAVAGYSAGQMGLLTVEWSPATGLDDPFSLTPIATVTETITYTVVATDPSGCESPPSSVTINVPTSGLSVAVSSATGVNCSGDQTQLTATATGGVGPYASYEWSPATGLDDPFSPTPLATVVSDIEYTVTVTDSVGCTATNSITLSPLSVSASAAVTSLCPGETTQLSAIVSGGTVGGPYTYSWSPTTGLDDPSSSTPIATVSTDIIYTVTVTDGVFCSTADSVSITAFTAPQVTVSAAATEVCAGTDVPIATVVTDGTAPYTYSWSPSPIFDDPTSATPVATVFNDVTCTVTVTDAKGCTASGTVMLAASIPSVGATSSASSVCLGNSVTLGAAVTGGTAPFTYSWSPGSSLSSSTIANPVATPLTTTFYAVTVTDALGCMTADSITVDVSQLQAQATASETVVCAGAQAELAATSIGGVGPYLYAWTPTVGVADPASATTTATVASTTTYTVTMTDAAGCTSSDTVTVTVSALEVIAETANSTHCPGEPAALLTSVIGGTPPFTYSWSPASGLDDPTSATPIATVSATTSFSVNVTDALGCTTSSVVEVVVAEPHVDIGTLDAVGCVGETTLLVAEVTSGTGPFTYTWVPSTGLDDPSSPTPTATFLSTNTTYTVTVTDSLGCASSDSITLMASAPQLNVTSSSSTVCAEGAVTLIATVTGGIGPYTYSWMPSTGLDDPSSATPVSSVAATTTYTVTVTDNIGCVVSDTFTVNVSDLQAGISTSSISVCSGASTVLNASVTGGVGPYVYSWSPSAGLSDANSPSPTATPLATTTYTVVVSDNNGCSSSDTVTISVSALQANASATPAIVCAGEQATLFAGVVGGVEPYSYSWSPAAGLNDTSLASPTVTVFSNSTYTVTVSDAQGCTVTSSVSVVADTLQASAYASPLPTCTGDQTTLAVDVAGGVAPYSYTWAPTPGLDDPSSATPIATLAEATEFTITVTDSLGCSATSSVLLDVSGVDFTILGETEICQGDRALLSVRLTGDAAAPLDYYWSPTTGVSEPNSFETLVSPHHSTVYSVTVVNANGCSSTEQILVNVIEPPEISPGNAVVVCGDGTATFVANGSGFISYQWFDVDSGIQIGVGTMLEDVGEGTYSLLATYENMRCQFLQYVHVTRGKDCLELELTENEVDLCALKEIKAEVTSGIPPYTFTVFSSVDPAYNGQSSTTSNTPSFLLHSLVPPQNNTDYVFTVTDGAGNSTTATIFIDPWPTGGFSFSTPASFAWGQLWPVTDPLSPLTYRYNITEYRLSIYSSFPDFVAGNSPIWETSGIAPAVGGYTTDVIAWPGTMSNGNVLNQNFVYYRLKLVNCDLELNDGGLITVEKK